MSDSLQLADRILNQALPGEELEILISQGTETTVKAYQGGVESLTSATSAGVGIRVLHEGPGGARIGTAWAGSLDEESITGALQDARDNVRFATEDEFLAFARPDGVRPVDLDLFDDSVTSTPLDDKIAMALELEARVRDGDPRIRLVNSASYADYTGDSALVSTTGIRAFSAETGAHLMVYAIAGDGHHDQTGYGVSHARGPRGLSVDDAVRDAIVKSTRMLGAIKPPSMKTTVVFDQKTTATLLAIIGGALSGEEVTKGRSFFAKHLGEQVAATSVTLIDDPTDPRHYGSSSHDGEGLATRRNVLINDGVLETFVYDTVSARRAGVSSTGSARRGGLAGSPSAGCRALVLAPGSGDEADVLRTVGSGLFIESLMGVHSGVNTVSGDFSVGVTGLLIENGELTQPVQEITVASTLQRMLRDVVAVGADTAWLPGSAAGATIAIEGLSVSGS